MIKFIKKKKKKTATKRIGRLRAVSTQASREMEEGTRDV